MKRKNRLYWIASTCAAAVCAVLALSPQTSTHTDVSHAYESFQQEEDPSREDGQFEVSQEETGHNSDATSVEGLHQSVEKAGAKDETESRSNSQREDTSTQREGSSPQREDTSTQRTGQEGETITRYQQEGTLEFVAAQLLNTYKSRGDCALLRSSTLDLFGQVWGCLVRGGDWLEMVFIQSLSEEGPCEVRIVRIES
ncbi:MAG: hypothetical protein IJ125_07725 [Atopobiaceae bacterium]|nr:hypothetical protein [Atopobiaceae bacterium]